MPHLTGRYGASGAIIDVWVGVSAPRRRLLVSQNKEVPPATRLSLLIDTGADTTMVNEQTMRSLQIPPRGVRSVVGSTTDINPTACDTHDVELSIVTPGEQPLILPAIEVLARPFLTVSIDGLLGRDVLDTLNLSIGRGRFRLEW